MDQSDDGPVAERDYPPGCIPASRRSQAPRAGTSSKRQEEDVFETPLITLPEGFNDLDTRDQFKARKHIFETLRKDYERQKENGKNIPRPDLTAMKQMRHEGVALKFKGIGEVPGVVVGDTFDYRSEMVVVGVHSLTQAGIAYAEVDGKVLATSIVASGGYEDDKDYGEVLHYSGQGGNDYRGEKHQVEDQKQKLGNEAMMMSYKHEKPIRVIRGHDADTTHGWNKIYSYDGLYTIFQADLEDGTSGYKVFKFQLKRNPNQPALKIRRVQFQGSQVA